MTTAQDGDKTAGTEGGPCSWSPAGVLLTYDPSTIAGAHCYPYPGVRCRVGMGLKAEFQKQRWCWKKFPGSREAEDHLPLPPPPLVLSERLSF